MKKFLTVLTALIMLILPLSAVSRSGMGSGDTRDEAKISAQVDLSRNLKVNLTSVSGDETLADSWGSSYDGFSSRTISSSSFPFIDLRWDYVREKDGEWQAKCTIDSSQKGLYIGEYESVVTTIDELYPIYEASKEDPDLSVMETLVDALSDLDGLRTILGIIAPDERLRVPVYTSYAAMSNRWRSELDKQMNVIRQSVGSDMEKSESDFASEAEWAEYAAQVESFRNFEKLGTEERRRAESKLFVSGIDAVKDLEEALARTLEAEGNRKASEMDRDSPTWHVNRINDVRKRYAMSSENIRNALTMLEYGLMTDTNAVYEESEANIAPHELDEDGKLTPEAYEKRQQVINWDIGDIVERYEKEAMAVWAKGKETLEGIRKDGEKCIDEVNGRTFRVSTDSSSMYISITGFNQKLHYFTGECVIVLGDLDYSFPIWFSFESLTGDKWVESTSIYEYNAQQALISAWSDLLNNSSGMLRAETELKLTTDADNDVWTVERNGWTVWNNADDTKLFENDEKETTVIEGKSGQSLNDMSAGVSMFIKSGEDDWPSGPAYRYNCYIDGYIHNGIIKEFAVPSGFIRTDGIGFPIAFNVAYSYDIFKQNLYFGTYVGTYFWWLWEGSDILPHFGLNAGLLLHKTFSNCVDMISFGPMAAFEIDPGFKVPEVKAGVRFTALFDTDVGVSLEWYTANLLDKNVPGWKSIDFRLTLSLSRWEGF